LGITLIKNQIVEATPRVINVILEIIVNREVGLFRLVRKFCFISLDIFDVWINEDK